MSELDAIRTAPPLELPDTGGETRGLPTDAAATVVVWTCNHCPYALAWHDRIVDVARDYADRGVRFLAVNSNDAERYPADSPAAMRERVEREDWQFPYLWDETQEAAREWGAKVTPHVFVLDGELRIRYEGAPDADHQDPSLEARWLRDALDAVLESGGSTAPRLGSSLEGSEPPAVTEPVGCSIKWRRA